MSTLMWRLWTPVASILLLALAYPAIASADDLSVSQADFSDVSRWGMAGSAAQSGATLELTNNSTTFQAGAAHYMVPFELGANTSFSAAYEVVIGPHSMGGAADGMTFVVQGAGPTAVGNSGGDLGVVGVTPGVAVVYDTFDADARGVRVCATSDGACVNGSGLAPSFDMTAQSSFFAWTDYDGPTNTLSVYISTLSTKPGAPLFTQVIDIDGALSLAGSKGAYFGFTASTGGFTSVHAVKTLELTVTEQRDADGDQIPDPFDADSDGDGISNLVECGEDPYGDADADGVENFRDLDRDGDMVNEQIDVNNDQIVDSCDADLDGVPNHLDSDSDGDGVPDSVEGHDGDGDGIADTLPSGLDTNLNGLDDAYDVARGGSAALLPDRDMDGHVDYLDFKALRVVALDLSAWSVDAQTRLGTGTISVQLAHDGVTSTADPVEVRLFVDRDADGVYSPATDVSLGVQSTAKALDGGDVVSVSFTGLSQVLRFVGEPIVAHVDEANVVAELDEADNLRSTSAQACAANIADLSASTLSYDLSGAPALGLLGVRVGNAGLASAPAGVQVAFYDGDPASGGTLIGVTTTLGALAPGQFEDVSLMWMPVLAPAPMASSLVVVVDDDGLGQGSIQECTEDNNVHALSFPVGAQLDDPSAGALLNAAPSALVGQVLGATSVEISIEDDGAAVVFNAAGVMPDAQGDFSVSTGGLTLVDGSYAVVVIASDAEGNKGAPVISAFDVDATAPTLSLASPADGALLNDATPQISGDVNEPVASLTVVVRDMQGRVVQTRAVTPDAQGDWSFDAATLTDGTYSVSVTAVDAAGNSATPVSASFEVDTTAPVITISAPAPNLVTNAAQPMFSGRVDDAAASVTVLVKDAQQNVVATLTLTPDAQGDWTGQPASPLADARYTLEVTGTDAAGNTSAAVTRAFVVDTTSPVVSLSALPNGGLTSDNTPTISGSVDDVSATLSVEVRDMQGTLVQTLNPAADAQGDFSVTTAALVDGAYTVSVTAVDAAGNSGSGGPLSVQVDTTPPTLSVASPADQTVSNNDIPLVSGSAEVGAVVTVKVFDGNMAESFSASPAVAANGSWSVLVDPLVDGVYTIVVSARDAAGNPASISRTYTVDTQPPVLSITQPADQSATNNTTPTLVGTAEPNMALAVLVTDSLTMMSVAMLNVTADAQGDWSIQSPTLAQGSYAVQATAMDAAGNAGAATSRFEVDTTPPTVSIVSPVDGRVTANVRPSIQGRATPSAQVTVTLQDDQGATVKTVTVTADASTGAWSMTLDADLGDGFYALSVVARDAAGNTTSAMSSFSVDTTALPLSIIQPSNGEALSTQTPAILGTTQANQSVSWTIEDAQGAVVQSGTESADLQGDWAFLAASLAEGVYTLEAQVQNLAGTTTTESVSFEIDVTPPALALNAPADQSIININSPTISGTAEAGLDVRVVLSDAQGVGLLDVVVTADGAGGWQVAAPQLMDGSYQLALTVNDRAGNATMLNASFSVDTVAPTLSIDAPVADQIFASRDVVVSGSAEPNASVDVELRDAQSMTLSQQQVSADAQGQWTLTLMMLADGPYVVRAQTQDAANNQASAAVSFSVDSVMPMVTIDAPLADAFVNTLRPAISGTASADAALNARLTDAQGAQVLDQAVTVDAQGAWSLALDADLGQGSHTLIMTATRPNNTMASAQVSFTVDTIAPEVTIGAPAQDARLSGREVMITGTSEPGSSVALSVEDAQGAQVATLTATVAQDGRFSATASLTADGAYTLSAQATDLAANIGQVVTVDFSVDSEAPLLAIDAPMPDDIVMVERPLIQGRGEAGLMVEVSLDGEVLERVVVDAQGQWQAQVNDALAPGEHTVQATSTDATGNTADTGLVRFVVRLPWADVTISSPANGAQVEAGQVVVQGRGEPGQMIEVSLGDASMQVNVGQDGTWEVTFADVAPGVTTITATDGQTTATSTVTVVEGQDLSGLVFQGGGCSSAAGPVDAGSAWLLLLVGGVLGMMRRRRRLA